MGQMMQKHHVRPFQSISRCALGGLLFDASCGVGCPLFHKCCLGETTNPKEFAMKLTWHGHSCVLIEGGGAKILVDPFFTGNGQAKASADEVEADFIVLTHGHGDHYGDTTAIAKRTGATVIGNFEVVNFAQKEGVEKAHPMHIGGGHDFSFGRLKLTIAHHGSSMPDGSYGGNPAGLLFTIDGKTLYHAGDTGLFMDMQLIGEAGIDFAILPIGDNFTMGPDDALRAVQFLKPKRVMPVHYNTWPLIEQDAQAWIERAKEATGADGIIPAIGESFDI